MLAGLQDKGVAAGEELAAATAAHGAALATFVESTLDLHFRAWTQWVKKVEAATLELLAASGRAGAAGGAPLTPQQLLAALPEDVPPPVEAPEAEAAVQSLAQSWRAALGSLNEEVNRYCSAAGVGKSMVVLKALFSKLAEYYQRGEILLARAFHGAPPAWLRDMVPIQNIFFEMRKYGRSGE